MARNVTAQLLNAMPDTPTGSVAHTSAIGAMRQSPTPPGPRGKGIPGWVTGVEGLPRVAQLRLAGNNGVVPQQGAAALQMLIAIAARYPATACPGDDDQRAAA
jgi:hypothetical protein